MKITRSQSALLAALICSCFAKSTSMAQAPAHVAPTNDLPVTTERVRNPQILPDGATISKEPRYYLDTTDNLNRFADDNSRRSPGLTKNNYITQVFTIHNTDAIQIQSYLLRILAYEGGIAEVMGGTEVKDDGGKGEQFLYVVAPDFMMPGVAEMVRTSDRPGFAFNDSTGRDFGNGPGSIAYVGKHRTASELTAILKGTELGNIGNFIFPPFADDSTNSIYIVDNPTDIGDDVSALKLFDRPPLQLELEVTIYEVGGINDGKLGLDWDAWKRSLTGSFQYTSSDSQVFFADKGDNFATLLTLDARVLADFLNYTVQTGRTRVMTSTMLTMVNSEDRPGALSGGNRGASTGVPAVIESATTIPFAVIHDEQGPTNAPNARNEDINTTFEGVRVEFLPFIGTDSITLTLNMKVNSLVGYSKETDLPLISTRSLNSVLNVANNQTLVTGGLDRESRVDSRVGIPLLKDIPVVQYLFSKQSKRTETTKILISLVPHIKEPGSDEKARVVDFKDKTDRDDGSPEPRIQSTK